jgi:hypothetical protein
VLTSGLGGVIFRVLASGVVGGVMVRVLTSGAVGGVMVRVLVSGVVGGVMVRVLASGAWKPRIYSTRGDENPGSTAPEAMEARDLQHQRRWKSRIYSIRGDGNAGSTASEASTLSWSCTIRTSSSLHLKLTCSRHEIAEKLQSCR